MRSVAGARGGSVPSKVEPSAERTPPNAGKGRKKGVPNKTTALLKEAVLTAAARTGHDKEGKEGLIGYCRYLAENEPRAFATLLGRIIPMQVEGDGGTPLQVIIKRFSDVDVDSYPA